MGLLLCTLVGVFPLCEQAPQDLQSCGDKQHKFPSELLRLKAKNIHAYFYPWFQADIFYLLGT